MGWTREYVCAEDRVCAMDQFKIHHPEFSDERLLGADWVEVERCD